MKPSDERKLINDETSRLNSKPGKTPADRNRLKELLKRLKELKGRVE
jgi:hypothetical protein